MEGFVWPCAHEIIRGLKKGIREDSDGREAHQEQGNLGILLEPGLRGSSHMELSWAEPEEITWSPQTVGPPPAGRGITVRCVASRVAGNGRKLGTLTPGVTSLVEKEPELVWKVDWYQLDGLVHLNTFSGAGTKVLGGWDCPFPYLSQVGARIFTSPRVRANVLEFSLVNERVASMQLRVAR